MTNNGRGASGVVLIALLLLAALAYFDYRAYQLRFPEAPAWTYLFK